RAAHVAPCCWRLLVRKRNRGCPPAKMIMNDVCPGRTGQFVTSLTEKVDDVLGRLETAGRAARDIVHDAENSDQRRWRDRLHTRLVVETHVSSGHRRAQFAAAVREAADGLTELPHDRGILR